MLRDSKNSVSVKTSSSQSFRPVAQLLAGRLSKQLLKLKSPAMRGFLVFKPVLADHHHALWRHQERGRQEPGARMLISATQGCVVLLSQRVL